MQFYLNTEQSRHQVSYKKTEILLKMNIPPVPTNETPRFARAAPRPAITHLFKHFSLLIHFFISKGARRIITWSKDRVCEALHDG